MFMQLHPGLMPFFYQCYWGDFIPLSTSETTYLLPKFLDAHYICCWVHLKTVMSNFCYSETPTNLLLLKVIPPHPPLDPIMSHNLVQLYVTRQASMYNMMYISGHWHAHTYLIRKFKLPQR